jgi:hypothetical protein
MKKFSILLILGVAVSFFPGCVVMDAYHIVNLTYAATSPFRNTGTAQQQQNNMFTLKASDNRASLSIVAMPVCTFNDVSIDPGKAISSKLYAKISEITPLFSAPSEKIFSEEAAKADATEFMLKFIFEQTNLQKTPVIHIYPATTKNHEWRDRAAKTAKAESYFQVVSINVSCSDDTPETCSRKLADAAVGDIMPVVSRFLKELGY